MNLQLLRVATYAGLFSGLGCAAYFILVYANLQTSPVARYIDFWIPTMAMVFSMWYVRSKRSDGHLHFWEALMMGNFTQLLTAILSASAIYCVNTYVSDASLQGYIWACKEYIINSRAYTIEQFGESAYLQQLADIVKMTAKDMFKEELFRKILYMFLLVPLIALILRKKAS